MDINYKKLSSFEALGIVVAATGVVLGLVFMFCAIPSQQQKQMAQAVTLLDMHQAAAAEFDSVAMIFDSTHEFLDQFYVAFSEVAVVPIPDLRIATTVSEVSTAIGNFSDEVALQYKLNNSPQAQVAATDLGQVLGASVEAFPPPKIYSSDLFFPYNYIAPSFQIRIHSMPEHKMFNN